MIPVFQTIFRPPRGNCFAACVASVLEVELDSVPRFEGADWHEKWRLWLAPWNADMLGYVPDEPFDEWNPWFHSGYVIAGVKSPRFDCLHAVVMRCGEVVHDPWPGVLRFGPGATPPVVDWFIIVPLDPSRPIVIPPLTCRGWHEPEHDEGEYDAGQEVQVDQVAEGLRGPEEARIQQELGRGDLQRDGEQAAREAGQEEVGGEPALGIQREGEPLPGH